MNLSYGEMRAELIERVNTLNQVIVGLGLLIGDGASVEVAQPERRGTPGPKPKRKTKPGKRSAKRSTAHVQRASPAGAKTVLYRDTIVTFLGKSEHHCADSSVIRHAVAKACGVDEKKDTSFKGDVSNALQGLKKAGTVTRQGTMWSLV